MSRKIDMGVTDIGSIHFGKYKSMETDLIYVGNGNIVFKTIIHLDEDDMKGYFDMLGTPEEPSFEECLAMKLAAELFFPTPPKKEEKV